VKANQSKFSN